MSLKISKIYFATTKTHQFFFSFPFFSGLIETTKGCCGTGTTEYAGTCKGLNTCDDASKYAFWDAVHPSQKMYQIFALKGIESVNENILS